MHQKYCFKIMKLKELYDDYLNKFEQNEHIVQELDFLHASVDAEDIVFCLFDNCTLIAILSVKINADMLENQYLVVSKQYRRQGLAEFLLNEQFLYAKNHHLALLNSKYSPMGKQYLATLNLKLAQKHEVLFFEHNESYEEVMLTFDKTRYQWDKRLKWEQEVYWNDEYELSQ
jgi:GNAT superfamily N-acetyltransferase